MGSKRLKAIVVKGTRPIQQADAAVAVDPGSADALLVRGEIEGPCTCYCINRETFDKLVTLMNKFIGTIKGADGPEGPPDSFVRRCAQSPAPTGPARSDSHAGRAETGPGVGGRA